MLELKAGLVGAATTTVTVNNIAKTMKSGALPVFATPAMCALMEEAASLAVKDVLDPGMGTVGISLNITHDRPSPMGADITATAILIAIEGRKLIYTVEAKDNKGIIGKGSHERFIINNEKFMGKL